MKPYIDIANAEPEVFSNSAPSTDEINKMFDFVCAVNNPFIQQAAFMSACEQTIDTKNWEQARLYADLVTEEYEELLAELTGFSHETLDLEKVAKEGIDLIYVVLGLLHSLGVDSLIAFDAVQTSNAAKVDPETGHVRRRADGKILKPENWSAPDMSAAV